jgi:hypothetical protein
VSESGCPGWGWVGVSLHGFFGSRSCVGVWFLFCWGLRLGFEVGYWGLGGGLCAALACWGGVGGVVAGGSDCAENNLEGFREGGGGEGIGKLKTLETGRDLLNGERAVEDQNDARSRGSRKWTGNNGGWLKRRNPIGNQGRLGAVETQYFNLDFWIFENWEFFLRNR